MKRYIILLSIVFTFSFPHKSEAFIPYGGYNIWTVPCVCSAAGVWYTWFTPLWLGGLPATGALAVGIPPTAVWFQWYDPVVPTTWSLGKFMPGVQSCWQPAPTGCIPWPVLGHVYEVGSSLPLSPP